VGWAIGDGREHGDDPSWDSTEAESLYALLENEVVPQFYSRDERGISRRWVDRMRASMARLTPSFSANRAARQYTDECYIATAAAFHRRAEKRGSLGANLVAWKADLAKYWPSLRFGSATVQQTGEQSLFQVQVFLGDMNSDAISVELYANGENDAGPVIEKMSRGEQLAGQETGYTYKALVPATRPAGDYTPRLIPQHEAASVPLEAPFILWHDAPSWR
jgi:starch phosphorylase